MCVLSVSDWLEQPDVLHRREIIGKALKMPASSVEPLQLFDMVITRQAQGIPLPEGVRWTPELMDVITGLAVEHVRAKCSVVTSMAVYSFSLSQVSMPCVLKGVSGGCLAGVMVSISVCV